MNKQGQKPTTRDFDGWLEDHGDVLFRFAKLRLGSSHLAEDIVQETFVKAFQGFSKFRGEASVRTWLFQILRNEINSHFRKAAKAKKATPTEPVELGELLHPELSAKHGRDDLTALINRGLIVKTKQGHQQIDYHS